MAKILTIITIVLAAVTTLVGFINRTKLVEIKTTLSTTQAELASTQKNLDEKTGKLGETEKSLADSTSKNEAAQTEINQLKASIETKDNELADVKGKAMAANVEFESLKSKVESITKLKDDITQKLIDKENEPIQQELNDARKQLDEQKVVAEKLTVNIDTLNGRIKTLEAQIAENKRQQKVNDLSGKILAVNEAWNFVVLSVGDKDGVSSNAELLVKRGNIRIGKVRVTSVEPASSIADIIPGSLIGGLSIQPGDYVISEYVAN